MDRFLRVFPWVLTVALLALATIELRSAIGWSGAKRLAAAPSGSVAADLDSATEAVTPALPKLLPADDAPQCLVPAVPAPEAVLAAGFPTAKPAAESAALPGPELTSPSQVLERPSPADKAPAESLLEMPLAETAPLVDEAETVPFTNEAKTVESPREVASPKASPLATAATARDRSEQLEQVAKQADRRTRHGFELAGRGAYFAARSEFIGALRLVAEGLDTEQKTGVHGRALAAALLAMKEAEDFLPGGSRLEADLDMPGIIAAHSTPVLKDNADKVTSTMAFRCYVTFAQEQFAASAGREVAGSMALHAMGKLHAVLAQKKGISVIAPECKAVVFYQAALLVYPKNHMPANDLGVLLAKCGNYADARKMLEYSLSLSRQSAGWQNLAVVYRQLGQTVAAERATEQAARLRQIELARRRTSAAVANDVARWVDPQAFAQTSMNTSNAIGATPLPLKQPATAANWPTPGTRPANRTGTVASRNADISGYARRGSEPAATFSGPAPSRTAPETNWPAPTPAAAERMSWGAPAYQR